MTARNAVKYAACSVSNFNHEDGSISEREMGRMEVTCAAGAPGRRYPDFVKSGRRRS